MAEEEEVVYDLTNPDVVAKYGFAAGVANRALAKVIELIQPGARIADICSAGDEFITSQLKSQFRGAEKGVAFPTCLSVNDCAGHFSPLFSETPVLQEGDLVKIDLGAHVDGLIGVVGHTVVCTADPSVPTTGRKSDVICAAYYAAEAALRLLRPGNKSSQIPPVLEAIAKTFNCNMVEGVVSHQLKRFVLDGEKTIPSRITPDTPTPVEIEFEESEVYAVDIVVSTGEGKLRERDARTTVYQRETNTSYSLQMKAAKAVFKQVNQRYPALPFSLRALDDEKQTRLGIVECVKHEVLRPFPVLFERPGEFIAQFKFTVLLLPKEIKKITFGASIPFVQSEFKIEDPKINQILSTGLKRGANKKKKKTKKTGTATTTTSTTTTATDAMETE